MYKHFSSQGPANFTDF